MQPSQLFESVAATLWSLATFDVFVAPALLISFYYLGAVGGPVLVVYGARRLVVERERYELPQFAPGEGLIKTLARTRTGFVMMAILAMVFFELLWRVLFEAMLAYFQMHGYLSDLAQK